MTAWWFSSVKLRLEQWTCVQWDRLPAQYWPFWIRYSRQPAAKPQKAPCRIPTFAALPKLFCQECSAAVSRTYNQNYSRNYFSSAFWFQPRKQARFRAQFVIRAVWMSFSYCSKYFKAVHDFLNLCPLSLIYLILVRFNSSLGCLFKCFTSFVSVIKRVGRRRATRLCIISGPMFCPRYGTTGNRLPNHRFKTIMSLSWDTHWIDHRPRLIHIGVYNLNFLFYGNICDIGKASNVKDAQCAAAETVRFL